MVHWNGKGVWLPCPLYRRLQHEPLGEAETAGPVMERAGHPPSLRSAEGIFCLCVRDMRANWGSDTKLNKQTKNTKHNKTQECEDGEKYQHPEEKKEFKTKTTEAETPEGFALQKGLDIISWFFNVNLQSYLKTQPSSPPAPPHLLYFFGQTFCFLFSEGFSVCLGFCFLLWLKQEGLLQQKSVTKNRNNTWQRKDGRDRKKEIL